MVEFDRFQDLSKFSVSPGFRGRSGVYVLLWQMVQNTLFRWSPQPAYSWRRMLLRLFGAKVGRGVLVRQSAEVTFPWKVTLGEFCWIGDSAVLYSLGEITIGAHAVISQRSYICTGSHDLNDVTFSLEAKPIIIGDQAWVATDCFIAPGVIVGRGAVVAARSTVLTNVPEKMIVAGAPAIPKKPRIPPRF